MITYDLSRLTKGVSSGGSTRSCCCSLTDHLCHQVRGGWSESRLCQLLSLEDLRLHPQLHTAFLTHIVVLSGWHTHGNNIHQIFTRASDVNTM